MLNHFTNLLLVLTAFAPVLFTYSFVLYRQGAQGTAVMVPFIAAVLLTLLCWFVVELARKHLPDYQPFAAVAIKPVDGELLTFLIAYLFPLVNATRLNVDWWVVCFVILLLVAVVWATHAFHFNPMLAILRYHFYEVTSREGITYIILSRRDLRATAQVTTVKQLGPYVLMDSQSGASN